SIVNLGSSVQIEVSAGLAVPNVVGQKTADATEALKRRRFVADVQASDQVTGPPDTVLQQNPTGGAFASAGSKVVLTTVAVPAEATKGSSGSKAEAPTA